MRTNLFGVWRISKGDNTSVPETCEVNFTVRSPRDGSVGIGGRLCIFLGARSERSRGHRQKKQDRANPWLSHCDVNPPLVLSTVFGLAIQIALVDSLFGDGLGNFLAIRAKMLCSQHDFSAVFLRETFNRDGLAWLEFF